MSQCPNVAIGPIAVSGCGEKEERFKNDDEEKVAMLNSTKQKDTFSRFNENVQRQENSHCRGGEIKNRLTQHKHSEVA